MVLRFKNDDHLDLATPTTSNGKCKLRCIFPLTAKVNQVIENTATLNEKCDSRDMKVNACVLKCEKLNSI